MTGHKIPGVVAAVALHAAWTLFRRRWRRRLTAGEAVLVTGCDSGFGARIVEVLLDKSDATIYAGYVTDEGGKKLSALGERVVPLRMDVTKDSDVAAAFDALKKSGMPLRGVVNNAGIGVYGWCEELTMDRYEKNIDVNLLGSIRVTKSALPLLRMSKGRLVTMGSVGGRFPTAFGSAYVPTKAALNSFQDCVRQEVYRFGVKCSIVEPGFFATGMLHRSAATGEESRVASNGKLNGSASSISSYESYAEKMKRTEGTVIAIERLNGGEKGPDHVVDAVMDGLTAVVPKTHYLCGVDANIVGRLVAFVPSWIIDLVQTYLV